MRQIYFIIADRDAMPDYDCCPKCIGKSLLQKEIKIMIGEGLHLLLHLGLAD